MFGYALTISSLVRHGVPFRRSVRVALASDTVSIAAMELADNTFVLLVPGAISAGLNTALFWISLGCSLVVTFFAAFPPTVG